MKILQLCNKPPIPHIDGGCLAMDSLTQGFLRLGHEVKVLCIETHKHPFKKEKFTAEYLEKTRFESIFIDTRLNIVDAFSNLITQDSYNISRFFSPDFDMRLKEILQREKFDIVQFESLFMMPYLGTAKRLCKGKMILRSHNLEYIIWKRMADGAKNIAKKFYLNHLANRLRAYESEIIPRVHGIVSISQDDYGKYSELLKNDNKLLNIPFGIELSDYSAAESPGEFALFHLGSLDWMPNLEGITWFLEDVWPEIHSRFPDLKFYLAGRNIPNNILLSNYPNVEIVGEVEDAKEFIKSKAIMIVPILSAGGMRVKIIEGLALGKTIISTTLGAEGFDYEKNKHIYVADEKEEFISILEQFNSDKTLIDKQRNTSRKLAEDNFDNTKLVEKLIHFYSEL